MGFSLLPKQPLACGGAKPLRARVIPPLPRMPEGWMRKGYLRIILNITTVPV
ncbi:hypothetical protein AZA_82741 [Nitrospirillum viridazoti Y2]|nr:hypothetical protein AZA_82741 [Nitrospirillum amazonense Y2]